MKIRELAAVLEQWAPLPAAESYDNPGLLAGEPEAEIRSVLVSLDVTEAVLDEAQQLGANLVIAHHPIWFTPRKRLTGEDYVSRILIRAIRQDISLYAIHTNLDNVRSGVNHRICERLGLEPEGFLRPAPGGELGAGMTGMLPAALPQAEFLQRVKAAFGCGGIRYAAGGPAQIRRVAVCGGAGSFLIPDALRAGADAFVTADITYHKFFDAEGRCLLLDIGHYESEQFTSQLICEFLSKHFRNFAVHLSGVRTNPVHYF
ncbi:MAG: Nif3-like dinuclear metal center hexameric protein [Bacteroidia bacterium]|nr:Nif3-like dinuclear metal center hexameric protein [Bacteroidia bacterium]